MTGANYEFRVRGRLSKPLRDAVGELGDVQVEQATPETLIYGQVADQAQLRGILALLDNLGLRVVSMHRIPALPERPE
ncbi:hypothetical protein [Amycolatopsis sp. GM8]|uniref:hypothetical protein n=1 Tax=Amycolatopsis sp. GM8 TaxID=2896530 RepID=UPI001F165DC9|nr:hypothetical protein [Amycolatopsis sp. GM8]